MALFLGDNQLTGEIPADLGSLTELEWASLNQNQLTGEIPSELGSLVNLRSLSLGDNHLTGEIPAELGNLANLERLRLFNNQLTGEIPSELGRLTNLTLLYLSGNQLTGCVPASLRDVADNDFAQLGLSFCTSQDPLITRYDTNRNGAIDRSEVIKAINDYLSGEGDTITRAEVIRLINLYLGGPPAAQQVGGAPRNLTADGQRADADRPVVCRAGRLAPIVLSGGAAITGWRIEVSNDRFILEQSRCQNSAHTPPATPHTGLTAGERQALPGVGYQNSAGTGPASNVATATADATDWVVLLALHKVARISNNR